MNPPNSPVSVAPNSIVVGGVSRLIGGDSNNNNDTINMFYVSPTCVIEQSQLHHQTKKKRNWAAGLPEVPEIGDDHDDIRDAEEELDRPKRVRFSIPSPEEENDDADVPDTDDDEVPGFGGNPSSLSSLLWYSRKEIQAFQQVAKEQVLTFRKKHSKWIQQFCHDLSLDPNERPPPLQHLLQQHAPPDKDFDSVRGLQLDSCLIQNRRLHAQRILLIQQKCPCVESRPSILRSTSLQTSRSMRLYARWLAHYDHVDMVRMIRQELQQQEQEPSL